MPFFYDPTNGMPLNGSAAFNATIELGSNGVVHNAVNWATGSIDSFNFKNIPNRYRNNHFTIMDAREAMYRALTGASSDGATDIAPVPGDPVNTEVRKAYWATVFRSLGDVVHLVQDMGQPQHTRNEAHSPLNKLLSGKKSTVYEAYTEARTLQEKFECFNGSSRLLKNIVLDGYPIPDISGYEDVFATANGNVPAGNGLAEYSNRGFFTPGANFGNSKYSYPMSDTSAYTRESIQREDPCLGASAVNIQYKGTVIDHLTGNDTNVPLTNLSAIIDTFPSLPVKAEFSLDEVVFESMADLLMPRAVAYSASLINYFFRGRMEFKEDAINPGQYRITNLSTEEMNGVFALYYDDVNDVRHEVPGASWNLSLMPQESSPLIAVVSPVDPEPKIRGHYTLGNV